MLTRLGTLARPVTQDMRYVSRGMIVLGVVLCFAFHRGPSSVLSLGIGMLGGGATVYAFSYVYEHQSQLPRRVLIPYAGGFLLVVCVVSAGVGYGIIDYRIGGLFFAAIAAALPLFSWSFTYLPESDGDQ